MCLQCRSLPLPLTPASDPTAVNSTCATTLRSRPSNLYGSFIRFESISLKDATQTQYPALAFSAKFAYVLSRSLHLEAVTPDRDPLHRMTSMTGVFTAEILSQIAGQSTAPLASQTSAAVASTTAQAFHYQREQVFLLHCLVYQSFGKLNLHRKQRDGRARWMGCYCPQRSHWRLHVLSNFGSTMMRVDLSICDDTFTLQEDLVHTRLMLQIDYDRLVFFRQSNNRANSLE